MTYRTIGFHVDDAQDTIIRKYIEAVQIIQSGSNVDMYDDWEGTLEEKYNYNNVWHLVKQDGMKSHWTLYYEGALVIDLQESDDADYSVLFFNINRDTEVEAKFFRRAGI